MGMTIDEAIYCMECKYYEARNNNTCASSEGHQVAIDTMRKYQKIQEIYLKWNRNYGISTSSAWTEVIEVLEDGNDD